MLCALRQDDDPYVRKTAAVCVAKLYDINPELVEDRGFLDLLKARPCCPDAAAPLAVTSAAESRLGQREQHAAGKVARPPRVAVLDRPPCSHLPGLFHAGQHAPNIYPS